MTENTNKAIILGIKERRSFEHIRSLVHIIGGQDNIGNPDE